MHRRQFLQGASFVSLAGTSLLAWPGALRAGPREPRFVLVILRGGLDGLAAIAPYGDRAYRKSRGALADNPDDLLALDGFFGAHSSLSNFHRAYLNGDALAVHAVASAYRDRSHFDAQNVLELGLDEPHASDQGWLNRALTLSADRSAIAIAPSVPLVLRGSRTVSSWTPSLLPEPNDDTMARLLDLYDAEQPLGSRLRAGLAVDGIAAPDGAMMSNRENPNGSLPMDALARFLTAPEGPRIAVLEVGGWDTHANQANQLDNRLRALDSGFGRLESALGDAWQDTVIVAVSEFGRTVATNGTVGTDHGTAGVALLLGGAVNGGRVITDWPGLADLYQGRDLQPTIDVRGLFAALLGQQLGFAPPSVAQVFPGVSAEPLFGQLVV